MMIKAANLEEYLASMKATLERHAKGSLKKDTKIKHQSKQIANLMKMLEKWLFKSSNKGLEAQMSDQGV